MELSKHFVAKHLGRHIFGELGEAVRIDIRRLNKFVVSLKRLIHLKGSDDPCLGGLKI